jgi:hypothetical protein
MDPAAVGTLRRYTFSSPSNWPHILAVLSMLPFAAARPGQSASFPLEVIARTALRNRFPRLYGFRPS